jgi:hypothetical protein
MTREPPSNGQARRKSMPKRAREATEGWQLNLLLNAARITKLDVRNRAVVVNLLARLLLEAAQETGKAAADDEA